MIFITPFADLWRTSASPSIIFSFERTGTVWSGHRNRFLKACGKHGKIDPVGTDEIDPVKTA